MSVNLDRPRRGGLDSSERRNSGSIRGITVARPGGRLVAQLTLLR